MKILNFNPIYIITFLLLGCNSNSSTSNSEIGLEAAPLLNSQRISTLSIPLKNKAQYVFQSGSVLINEEGDEEYWGLDPSNNSISIFNLSKKEVSTKIKIPQDGPEAINNILNFFVHTPDSIFIVPVNSGRIFLIDSKAKIIGQWNYQNLNLPTGESLSVNIPFPIAEIGTHFFYQKSKSFLTLPLWLRGSGTFYEVPPLINLDLKNNKVAHSFGEFPENYKGSKVSIKEHFNLVQMGNGEILVSFFESHFIQKYSPNGEYLGQYAAKSNFVENFTLFENYPENDIKKNYWVEKGFYIGLLYDPYKDLIYRIVCHGQPIKDINGRLNILLMAKWSIIILSADGKLLGEIQFDGSKHRFNDGIHVSKDGILASLENIYNEDNIEESLEFELIQFNIK